MTKELSQASPRRSNQRTVLELLRSIRSGEVYSEEVSREERRACVAYLKLEGYTQPEIAEIFQVHRRTIVRDERAIRQEAARLVDELDVKAVAGSLIGWSKHITAKAMKEKDHALAWKVQRELVSDLQGLGYLPKAAEQYDVRVDTFVNLARLAVDQAGRGKLPTDDTPEELPAPKDAPEPDDEATEANSD